MPCREGRDTAMRQHSHASAGGVRTSNRRSARPLTERLGDGRRRGLCHGARLHARKEARGDVAVWEALPRRPVSRKPRRLRPPPRCTTTRLLTPRHVQRSLIASSDGNPPAGRSSKQPPPRCVVAVGSRSRSGQPSRTPITSFRPHACACVERGVSHRRHRGDHRGPWCRGESLRSSLL